MKQLPLFSETSIPLPPFRRRPAFRVFMRAAGQDFYITTYYGSANAAARYASKLEARTGKVHEVREIQ